MILISILGDFHSSIIPIFFEMKDKIKKHIIIHDDSKYDTKNVKKIINGEKEISKMFNLDFEIITLKIDEDNYEQIINCYTKIIKYSQRDYSSIYLNGTDGLSSSIVILANRLINLGANFISYDRYENQCNLITKDEMKKNSLKINNTIRTHLIQKDYRLLASGNVNESKERKDVIFKLCNNLDNLKNFSSELQGKKIDDINGYDEIKKQLKLISKDNDVSFIQGTLFEEYIFWLIKDNLELDDIMFNVKIEFDEDMENEFDILMIKDNHLHAIECKLRNFIKGDETIYKLDSIMDFLDEDGKGMILSVGGDNERTTKYGNIKRQFSLGSRSRARNSEIKIHQVSTFDKNKFLNDIKNHFLISNSK